MKNRFLSGNNLDGNFGIRDQILALKWVQSNIENFGGSKDKVTIFGQSAGAMSVALHLTMTESKGLFSKAIIESNPFGKTILIYFNLF
jgi:carboxylesterase type B